MIDGEVTNLLVMWRSGDRTAAERLAPLLYGELRRLAASHLRRQSGYQTLQPTALIHEAWLRLSGQVEVCAEDRVHFFGICSRLMRHVLVDRLREKKARKRGGDVEHLQLDEAIVGAGGGGGDLEALHAALEALEKLDGRKAKVIELRYFGGLTAEEIAMHLNVGTATVTRDLKTAQAWLMRELKAC